MFATLLGALPPPPGGEDVEAQIRTALAAQEAAGLEPLTDGRLRGGLMEWVGSDGSVDIDAFVAAWQFAARHTDRAVKQALPGPYSVGRRMGFGADFGADFGVDAVARMADGLRDAAVALAAAGCPMVEIEEAEAHHIGADDAERTRFRDAHARVTDGVSGTHLSLSIVGGSAWSAGLETIIHAPYASLAVDLIDGPDNWNLVTRLPGDRGVIVGTLPAKDSPADAKEMLLWAARYAAGANRRGLQRVGIGSAGSWANLTWEAAVAKMQRLGEAARLAATAGGEALAQQLDPRAVDARRAAMGHDRPR